MLYVLKQWWSFIAHGVAGLIVLVNPKDIQAIAANHPKTSVAIMMLWGYLLAWAKSPKTGGGPA